MKTVLLTGASGFIGKFAIGFLLERGFVVHAVASKRRERETVENLIWHRANLIDRAEINKLVSAVRPTHLLHLAWYVEHGKCWTAPENFAWVSASQTLMQAFAESGGKRAVCAGTCAEYSWTESVYHESETLLAPKSVYGKCKQAWHILFEAYAAQTGISAAWGRAFFLYGPREHPNRLVSSVCRALLRGEPALCTHGNQIRDFMYVEDVASAYVALLESEVSGAVNIASGVAVTLKEIIYKIGDLAGEPHLIELGALAAPVDDPAQTLADIRRLEEEVGWQPKWTLDEGLARTVDWWRTQIE